MSFSLWQYWNIPPPLPPKNHQQEISLLSNSKQSTWLIEWFVVMGQVSTPQLVHEYKTTWTEALKKVKNKERRVLHLWNLFNLPMQSDCSVVYLGYSVSHNGRGYLEGRWKGLLLPLVLFICLASVAEIWYVVKKNVSQKLAVGWMNYFEEGSLLFTYFFVVYSSVMGKD